MFGWLNVASFLLGIIAWILPAIYLLRNKKDSLWPVLLLSLLSLSACGLSLLFQILYGYHLVKIEDWSALLDTRGAVASAAAVLLVVTLLLNAASLIVSRSRN